MTGRRLIAKGEVFLITAILLAGAVLFCVQGIGGEEPRYAIISSAGQEDIRVDLGTDKKLPLPWNENVIIIVENGQVAFLSSDCPDQICVNTGFIGHSGRRAVCLPNRVAVFVP